MWPSIECRDVTGTRQYATRFQACASPPRAGSRVRYFSRGAGRVSAGSLLVVTKISTIHFCSPDMSASRWIPDRRNANRIPHPINPAA